MKDFEHHPCLTQSWVQALESVWLPQKPLGSRVAKKFLLEGVGMELVCGSSFLGDRGTSGGCGQIGCGPQELPTRTPRSVLGGWEAGAGAQTEAFWGAGEARWGQLVELWEEALVCCAQRSLPSFCPAAVCVLVRHRGSDSHPSAKASPSVKGAQRRNWGTVGTGAVHPGRTAFCT